MPAMIVPTASGAGGRAAQYTGKFTLYVFLVCLAAASGGLLFGYDIGVTGGVTSMPAFLSSFFPSVAAQQHAAEAKDARSPYCKFDSPILQLFTSSLFLAGLVSSLVASGVTRRAGRKASMLVAGLAFLAGAAMTSCAGGLLQRKSSPSSPSSSSSSSPPLGSAALATLVLGRVSLGVGVGFANQAVPLYLNEMSPAHLRGAFNIMFQLATTVGIIVAQLVNVGTSRLGAGGALGWRVSLACAALPAAVLTLGGVLLPDTPNSLVSRGKRDEALRVLRRVRGVRDVGAEFDDICAAADAADASGCSSSESGWKTILKRKYRPELTMALLIPLFQQMTGINAIMFYAPVILSTLGMGTSAALANTAIIGAVNVLATLVAVALVDRAGRRPLFLFGGAQMAASQVTLAALLGIFFKEGAGADLPKPVGVAVIAVICVYVSAFAFSWGPLGWLVPAEVQPLETRSVGQSINVSMNFLLTALMGQLFVSLLCSMKFGIFLFFGGFVVLMTLFVFFLVPETRGVPTEEVRFLFEEHFFWKRFVDGGGEGKKKKSKGGSGSENSNGNDNGDDERGGDEVKSLAKGEDGKAVIVVESSDGVGGGNVIDGNDDSA